MSEANGSHRLDERAEVTFEPSWARPAEEPQLTRLHVLLFVATLYSTTLAGVQATPEFAAMAEAGLSLDLLIRPSFLALGLPFSLTLLGILGIHEMGHYVASRAWRVRATLPYFIPFPSIIGTLGAVIRIKSRMPHRKALIDIGVAGPLAGFVAAAAATSYGLAHSEAVPLDSLGGGGHYVFGDSVLTAWLQRTIIGDLPPGWDVYLHPVGFAGWLGLFVTVLNLLPVGQFDGGHVVFALFGGRHQIFSRGTIVALCLFWAVGPSYDWVGDPSPWSAWMGSRWPGWLLWSFLAFVLGRRHPPTVDQALPLGPGRKALGFLAFVIFLLCFVPRPIHYVSP